MGLRSIILGHAYKPVVEAAYRQALRGNNFVRPAAIEVEVAEHVVNLIASADMVKFAKNGSDANDAAIKLARAYTGRDLVGVCIDHPFFSVNDWFIGTTAMDAGIPKAIKDLTVGFHYNNIESVKDLFAKHPGQIACLILEAEKAEPPANNFLLEAHCFRSSAATEESTPPDMPTTPFPFDIAFLSVFSLPGSLLRAISRTE